jgi:hypothetical protein
MAEMSVAFLETGLDHSRLSPVIGYSAFISCFVRVSSYCLQQNPSDHNFNDLTGAMDVLKRLKEYWHPLQRLVCLLPRNLNSSLTF